MRIDVFKSLDGAIYYGDVPESFGMPESLVDTKSYDSSMYWPLLPEFIFQMNEACGTTLDIGDVEFLDVSKCRALVKLLESLEQPADQHLAVYYADLGRYARKAIGYGTGIVVEM